MSPLMSLIERDAIEAKLASLFQNTTRTEARSVATAIALQHNFPLAT